MYETDEPDGPEPGETLAVVEAVAAFCLALALLGIFAPKLWLVG